MEKHLDHRPIPLTERFTEDEMGRLRSFRARFNELWANFKDLETAGLNLNGHHVFDINDRIQTTVDLGVSRFRIKGFLVDYRHFHGQDEPAHFHSVMNVITRRCRDQRLIEVLDRNREDWNDAGTLSGWHNDFTLGETVDAVFKEDVFHTVRSGKQIRVRLDDVAAKLSTAAMWYEMTYMAYSRMLIIRNINWILDPVFLGKQEVRVPY